MSLREQVQSLGIWKPIKLVFFAGLGVLCACLLVVHLGTGASMLFDPDESVTGLVAAGVLLISLILVLIAVVSVAASYWQAGFLF